MLWISFIQLSCAQDSIPDINALHKIALIQLKAYLHSNVTDYHGCVENR
jgi:hypothetical protein